MLIVFLTAVQGFAQVFKQVDFERLLMNHPMMKNYDAQTGHFKNTPYELKNLGELKAENASMAAEIEKINGLKAENALAASTEDIEDEERFWKLASDLDTTKNKLSSKIAKNYELILSEGRPGVEELFPIMDDMSNDLILGLYNRDRVVLNKLPRYYDFKPEFDGKDFSAFWYSHDPSILEHYLTKAQTLSLIFPNSDRAVLYEKVE